jgi:hypothetical protein
VRGAERIRGVTLLRIDTARMVTEANEQIVPEMEKRDMTVPDGYTLRTGFEPWGWKEHGGTQFVVCCEGVGYEVSEDEPWEVPLYPSWSSGQGKLMGITPTWTQPLFGTELQSYVTEEEIDLADLVRRFGQRLEQNFWIWFQQLGGDRLVQAGPQ